MDRWLVAQAIYLAHLEAGTDRRELDMSSPPENSRRTDTMV